jgi:hypothetical protein
LRIGQEEVEELPLLVLNNVDEDDEDDDDEEGSLIEK